MQEIVESSDTISVIVEKGVTPATLNFNIVDGAIIAFILIAIVAVIYIWRKRKK